MLFAREQLLIEEGRKVHKEWHKEWQNLPSNSSKTP